MGEIVRQKVPQKMTWRELVLESAALSNILPVISTCNVRCRFCSHGQNPPGTESLGMPPISMEVLEEALSLMDPKRPVVIGESVTRLMEGEPFVHPRIRDILGQIRKKLPSAEIRVTTNGTFLDRETVDFLASLGGVTVCLSLNSASPEVRGRLMNDPRAGIAVAAPALLQEAGVPYHGSIVAMPHLTGWEDLAGTLQFLDHRGAATVRVFLPGCTRLAPPDLRVPPDMRDRLSGFIAELRPRLSVPVTLDPPSVQDLRARVAGVIPGSPAWRAGIRAGDIIDTVGGVSSRTRVDAFNRVLAGEGPPVRVIRVRDQLDLVIDKKKGQPSGLVMDYDIDPATVARIERAAGRKGAGGALVLASELGYPVVMRALEELAGAGASVRVEAVKNRFFGGSIGCAGLMTVADMMGAMRGHSGHSLVIVPGIAFDSRGRDITGRSYMDLEVHGGLRVEVI